MRRFSGISIRGEIRDQKCPQVIQSDMDGVRKDDGRNGPGKRKHVQCGKVMVRKFPGPHQFLCTEIAP